MKKISLLSLLICFTTGLYAQFYTVGGAHNITGTSTYCANMSSFLYSDNWTICTGSGSGGATVTYTWMADGASVYTNTFTAGSGGGTVNLAAGGIPPMVMSEVGAHGLQVKYTWSAVSGCTGTSAISPTFTFTVLPQPSFTVTPAANDCVPGAGAQLVASSGAQYSWVPSTHLTSTTGQTVLATPTVTTTYTVTGTYFPGCIETATTTVTPIGAPRFVATNMATNPTICVGGTSTLSTVINNSNYNGVSTITYSADVPAGTSTLTGTSSDNPAVVSLPFTFYYYGAPYTSVKISPNGYINFGASSTDHSSHVLTDATAPQALVALFMHDLSLASGGNILYETLGSAPYRKFDIFYVSVPDATGTATNSGQISLYEGTNNIDLLISNMTSTATATCGIQNLAGTASIPVSGKNGVAFTVTPTSPVAYRFQGLPSLSGYSYLWSPGSASTSSITVSPAATTVYTDEVTETATGCIVFGSELNQPTTIGVNPKPSASSLTPGAAAICTGGSTTLTPGTLTGGVGSFTGYTWSGSNGYSSTGTAPVTVSPTATATYSVLVSYSGSGCIGTVPAVTTVTVDPVPSVSGITASSYTVCPGAAVILTAGTVSGGGGSFTSYVWSGSDGFSSTVTPIGTNTVLVTPTVTATYSVLANYSGPGCTGATAAVVTINVTPLPTAGTITGTTAISVGSTATLSDVTGSGTGTWSSGTTGVATIGSGTGVAGGISGGTSIISYVVTNVCGTATATTTVTVPIQCIWTGGTSTEWNTTSNWNTGTVPTSSTDVLIPSGTTYAPVIDLSDAATRNLTITASVTVTVTTHTLTVTGDMSNNGIEVGTGEVELAGAVSQALSGNGVVNNIELNNSAGAVISGTVSVTGILTLNSGTLTTNGNLIIIATSTGSGSIGPIPASGTTISGTVVIQQYIIGRRAYRLLGHPFNAAIPLSQIQNYIDITGSGGAANGFTTTTSNAPSSFYATTGGVSSVTGTPGSATDGWSPFTNTDGSGTNAFNQYEGIALFCRGSKGQGLNGIPYTPNDVVISTYGNINIGVQSPTVGVTGSFVYNLIANPYPSPVDIGTVIYNASGSSVTGSAFYVWDPYLGTDGDYQSVPIASGSPYYIQGSAAFLVEASSFGGSLSFAESNKSSTISIVLLKEHPEFITLRMSDSVGHPYGNWYLSFNDAATDAKDSKYDAGKPPSLADFSFYSLSADNKKLSIDARPYSAAPIPLGIATTLQQQFTISVPAMLPIPGNGGLYLHDKYLQRYTLLQQGAEYTFAITADAASQGDGRFELTATDQAPALVQGGSPFQVTMVPNPATNEVTITYTMREKAAATVRIIDARGLCVSATELGVQQNGSAIIPLAQLPAGVYLVELTSGNEQVTKQLIKE